MKTIHSLITNDKSKEENEKLNKELEELNKNIQSIEFGIIFTILMIPLFYLYKSFSNLPISEEPDMFFTIFLCLVSTPIIFKTANAILKQKENK